MSQAKQVFKLWDEGEKPYYKENDLQEHEEETWGAVMVLGWGVKKMVPTNGCRCSSTG